MPFVTSCKVVSFNINPYYLILSFMDHGKESCSENIVRKAEYAGNHHFHPFRTFSTFKRQKTHRMNQTELYVCVFSQYQTF